jgi:hypothetical protein
MKVIILDNKRRAELLGRLYLEKNILNTEQLSMIKAQLKQPSFDYNAPADSLWTMYNHIAYALQRAHPKAWMDQQRLVHYFICQEFDLIQTLIPGVIEVEKPTNQLDLIDVIAEVEKETAIVEALPEIALEEISLVEEPVSLSTDAEVIQERISPVHIEAPVLAPIATESILEFEQRSTESAVVDQVFIEEPVVDEAIWNCLDCGEEQS